MEHKPILYIRADGSLDIGYGHVIRSLALAEILNKKFNCFFIIHQPDNFLRVEILKICKSIIDIPKFSILIDEAIYLAKYISDNSFVILDGYKFSSDYQKVIKKACSKLISIDDIYLDHFYSDVIINHSEGILENKYKKEWYSKVYLGSKYAILRKPFYEFKRTNKSENNSIFVNLGGTDPNNFTLKALTKALKIKGIGLINIVVGELFPFKEDILRLIKLEKEIKIKLHVNVNARKMASLMKYSNIGICAASSVSYEYSSLGGLLFIYKTADNQKNIYSFLIKEKIAYKIAEIQNKSKMLFDNSFFEKYNKRRDVFFSGNSHSYLNKIFTKLILETKISIREATLNDIKIYYNWVNEKSVRQNSINNKNISYNTHKVWFKAKLENESSFLYLFHKSQNKIGQVRFEILASNVIEIDFSIDKNNRGKGYSEIILRKAIFMFKSKHDIPIRFMAIVRKDNTPSWKTFNNVGFINKGTIEIHKKIYYKLELNLKYENREI